jgi:hypothetical protein
MWNVEHDAAGELIRRSPLGLSYQVILVAVEKDVDLQCLLYVVVELDVGGLIQIAATSSFSTLRTPSPVRTRERCISSTE